LAGGHGGSARKKTFANMYLAPYAWLTGSGFGMLREIPERLLALGVDLVTGGNHS
jgi:calcineurin-like phosphoesterase